MKSSNIERYATFNPTDRALFEGFSNYSLLMRFDALEIYAKRDQPKQQLLAEARHHIRSAITYLKRAKCQWQANILGGSLDEIHEICMAAAHYSHSRLIPGFFALSLTGKQGLQEFRDYLLIEAKYHTLLAFIKDSRNKSTSNLGSMDNLEGGCGFDVYVGQYEAAMASFCDELIGVLSLTLESETLSGRD